MNFEEFSVPRLIPADVEAYVQLRAEALTQEPYAFAASSDDDVALSLDFVRSALADAGQASFGAFPPMLVGIVGLSRERRKKTKHKANLRGLCVTPAHRRHGIGRAVVEAALQWARSIEGVDQVQLAVTGSVRSAAALYERLGFVTWGVEPNALRIGDDTLPESHMVLRLHCVG